ncbi:MAG: DUF503 domain-containing protein [Anaerolineae bacterium]|nr:DUF503 domain-containing protein [Anaerolineae bacterium]
MIIGACTVKLYLPGVGSLKGKRHLIKPLLNQLRRRFEVAAAETGTQDVWQSAEIAFVTLSNDTSQIYKVLEHAMHWIQDEYRVVEVMDWQIELR